MSSTENDYRIVRLSRHSLKDVERLHKEVYGTAPSEDYFAKKYDTAYTGIEHVGYIAYNRDQVPVAYYGVIPCFLQNGSDIVLVAQSADTMTHPRYRYKGMFVGLSNITFDLCRQSNIRLVFGFPNQNSFHGAVHKLAWKMTETMDCFIIPVQGIPLESISRPFSLFNVLYKKYLDSMLQKYLVVQKGLPNSVVQDGYAGIYRDDKYLQYKCYSKTHVIQVERAKLWIKVSNGLVIGDIEAVDDNNFQQVINKVNRIARKLGVKNILFHSSPGTLLHGLFSKRYKSVPSFPVLFQDFSQCIPLQQIKFTFADIDVF